MPPPNAARRSQSRRGSCCGSTATASSRSTGFRARTGSDYEMTPCLQPLAPFRERHPHPQRRRQPAAHAGPGNGHHNSMSGLMSGEAFSGRGAGGPSIDQVIAQKIGNDQPLPLAADRRLPGVVRREHSAQHELGRPRPSAAAGDDSAPAVRPAVRRRRTSTGSSARRACSTPCATTRHRSNHGWATTTAAAGRISDLGPQPGALGRQPAARVCAGGGAAGGTGDMKDWPRIAKLQPTCWSTRWPRGRRASPPTC